MIGYVTVGTDDLPAAVAFFDPLCALMKMPRCMEEPGHYVAWAPTPDAPGFSVTLPWNRRHSTPGNGTMVAFAVESAEVVNAIYEKAMAMGGTDEGAPGFRHESIPGFYAAYFRDLDGNKFNAFCIVPQ